MSTYQRYGQQPLALVAGSALASVSLCTQGLANVARDSHLLGPVSLNIISIAASGERKTSCDRRLSRAPRQWQDERREAMAGEVLTARSALAAYEAEHDGILAKIKSAAGRKGAAEDADLHELKVRLQQLESAPPRASLIPSLFHEDVTPKRSRNLLPAAGRHRRCGPMRRAWS